MINANLSLVKRTDTKMITAEQFAEVFPRAKDPEGWVSAMNVFFPDYGLDDSRRIAMFLAQCGHESAGWTVFEENLNYSANGLVGVFGRYFNAASAAKYARKPQAIANRVYANRMGNGPEESGDGWKYHGRGQIQLTGKNNYTAFAKDSVDNWEDLVDYPEQLAEDKELALLSALWFWKTNNLNAESDKEDVKRATKKINGGYNGLEDREALYDQLMDILA